MLRGLYSLVWMGGIPIALAYLIYRSIRQPAYRRHWSERFGFLPPAPHGARQFWIHAVSVGETVAAAPLVRRLAVRYPGAVLLLTHATPTGRDAGRELFGYLGARLRQSYLPYDLPFSVRRFLAIQRPMFGLVVETEVWPNLMHAARRSGTPMAVINARLSERSLARGLRYRRLIAPAIDAFQLIVAQTAADSTRIARLARPADAVVGNLKFDQAVSPSAGQTGAVWRSRLGVRPVVLAASTRDGEEAVLLDSWRRRAGESGDALLVIVPRHPNRFEAVSAMITAAVSSQRMMRRAALDQPDADLTACGVLLGDSMGEMQNWYACADVTIMGGSLLPFGSQNLIEANALGCPVVLGPSTFNFEEAARHSISAGAAEQVSGSDAAVAAALDIALDPARRQVMSRAALQFAQAHRGATDRTMEALEPLLRQSVPESLS